QRLDPPPVEAHQPGRDEVDAEQALAGEKHAAVLRLRGEWALALAGEDAVDDAEEPALLCVSELPLEVGVEGDAREVGGHAPGGVVAPPVAALRERFGFVRERIAAQQRLHDVVAAPHGAERELAGTRL